jgi:predicted PurR-regulated permease PerM
MTDQKPANSPRWGVMTKLVVSLALLAIVGAFLVHFKGIIIPLLLAFVLAYLFYPVATLIDRIPYLSWRMAVTLLYLFLIIIIAALLTLSGFSLVPQIQSLVVLVENSITQLPSLLDQFLIWVSQTSPVPINVNALNLDTVVQQLLAYVQPLLGSTGQLLGAIASGAAGIFGWGAFILVVSYFIMAESGGLRRNLLKIEIPGYSEDFNRLGMELQRIWNAFLRGQMIVFILAFIFYLIVLTVFGVRYSIGLALLAGFSKFLPYIGPAIVWVTLGLVSYFQPYKLFGMSPLLYTIIVFAFALVIDQLLDSFITPRIMAQALKVHPAGVLVAALVFADLLGVLGIILAAPMLATLILFGRYTMRKLLDQNPWPQEEPEPLPPFPWTVLITRLRKVIGLLPGKKQNPPSNTDSSKLSDSNHSQGEKT